MASQHISVRLSSELAERIAAHAAERGMTRSEALTSLLEHGLNTIGEAVTQCATVSHSDLVGRVTALEAAIAALQGNGLAAKRDPKHEERTPIPGDEKCYLGVMCARRHDHEGTGMSRRTRVDGNCVQCRAVVRAAKRAQVATSTSL